MNNFLTQLPIIIATLSKALLRAIKEQILEVVGAIQKFIRRLWLTYLKMESSVLGTVVDVGFSIFALRQFFALVAIGLIFLYFHWWWVFLAYVAIIAVAILRFFSMPPVGTDDQAEAHKKNKEKIIAFLRIPLRILFSLVIIYLSWSFNFFGKIEFHNLFAKNPEAKTTNQKISISPVQIVQPSPMPMPTSPQPVVIPQPQVINRVPVTEQPSQPPVAQTGQQGGSGAKGSQQQYPNVARVHTPGDGFLALRSEPSAQEGFRLNKIPHGTSVTLESCAPSNIRYHWCRTTYQGQSGWVFDRYLRP